MEEEKKPKSNWKRVMHYYWPFVKKYKWPFVLTYIAYTIGDIANSVMVPYLYRNIIDSFSNFISNYGAILPAANSVFRENTFLQIVTIIFVLLVARVLFSIGDYAMSRFQAKTLRDIAFFSFQKTIGHSYQFFINSFTGSLVKKAGRFIGSFENINDTFMYSIWLRVVNLIGVFTVLFFVAPILGKIYLVWTLIFLAMSFYFAKKRIKFDLREAEADSKATAQTADAFTNILNLKMFSSGKREESAYLDVANHQMNARVAAWNYSNFTYLLQGAVVTWLQIASLYISVVLWFDGLISVGTIVLAYSYSAIVFESVWSMGKQLSMISKSLSDAAEMVDIIDMPLEIKDPVTPRKLNVTKGDVSFEDVSFWYNNGNPIFEQFSLNIKAAEKVGIVGTSGAGKTTVTKLLLRFADVTGGSINIDGQDIRSITQDDLRSVISYVPQDPILFHRTLAENIAYGKPDATLSQIMEAAKQAHAHEFIEALPNGYDTLVGERGVKLSGGERQRVAIARAILKDSPILILDEATSSLDSVSEMHIKEALDRLMHGRTTIVIAHRLSTIEKMDRIIVLEKGKIVEEGNHRELLSQKGTYHNFWSHQNGGFIE